MARGNRKLVIPDDGDTVEPIDSASSNTADSGTVEEDNGPKPIIFDGTEPVPDGAGDSVDTGKPGRVDTGSIFGGTDTSGDGNGNIGDGGNSGTTRRDDLYYYNADGSIKRNRDGTPTAKRQRRGSSQTTYKTNLSLKEETERVAALFYVSHKFISVPVPEMELSVEESMILARPVTPILDRAGIKPPQWAADLAILGQAFVEVYGPRLVMIRLRMAEEKKAKEAATKARSVPTVSRNDFRQQNFAAPSTPMNENAVFEAGPGPFKP